ncbi:hypothetical protein GY45DRAFT_1319956 [Cubamyces sp. BRFM 1775]|nr:hypothetical protein GY45DRAFT_1319956 [Cubamyces sp. BRFM 1775]
MPPHRKPRRILTDASFYDKAGAIADGSPQPSPTATTSFWDGSGSFYGSRSGGSGLIARSGSGRMDVDRGAESEDDDEYTLTGYGEMSTEAAFMLPPSPTQTIKYRYRAYRPKLARLRKHRSSASAAASSKLAPLGSLKAKAGAHHHTSEYAAILSAYLSGTPGRSAKRDFQALIQKYRDSADGWRDSGDAHATPRRGHALDAGGRASTSVRRTGSSAAIGTR